MSTAIEDVVLRSVRAMPGDFRVSDLLPKCIDLAPCPEAVPTRAEIRMALRKLDVVKVGESLPGPVAVYRHTL